MSRVTFARALARISVLVTLAAGGLAHADEPAAASEQTAPPSDAPTPSEGEATDAPPADAPQELGAEWERGPLKKDLGHGIDFDVPEGYAFLPMPQAGKLMEQMGNLYNENLLGLVASVQDEPWFVTLRFDDEGHVKDDEEIDADDLLDSMREGLDEVNEERKQRNFSALRLDGWDEKPHYDRSAHQLIWCLRVSDEEGSSANYNTRVLGRTGVVSVNLVTDPQRVSTDKTHASKLLAATRFRAGSRYEDFDEDSDKVAEYGLAGLIAGGVGLGAMKVAKVGLLAKGWKLILVALMAGKKAIVLLLIGAAALVKRLLGGKSDQAQP